MAGDLLPNLGLPFPTIFLASLAHSIGGFGLVGPPFTNAYQSSDLGLNLGQNTITNHYHRGRGLGRDLSVGEVVYVM